MNSSAAILEKISATWSPQAREAAKLARSRKAQTFGPGAEHVAHHGALAAELTGGTHLQTQRIEQAKGFASSFHEIAHDTPGSAANDFIRFLQSDGANGASEVSSYPESIGNSGWRVSYSDDGGDRHHVKFIKRNLQAKGQAAQADKVIAKDSDAILSRLDPVKQLIKAGAPIGNNNAARHHGETDYGFQVRQHESKPHNQLCSEYENACKTKTGAPPLGNSHKSFSKRQLAVKLTELNDKFDSLGKIQASAPIGNRNAAGHHEAIARHDSARFEAKTPAQFKAHSDSIAAYKASEQAEASGHGDDHTKAMGAHYKASNGYEMGSPDFDAHRNAYIAHSKKRSQGINHETPKPAPRPTNPHPVGSREHNRHESYYSGSDD